MTSDNLMIGSFVRGYFSWLEKQQIPAAVLHDWEGDFEDEISDVDYVIEARSFPLITKLVHDYCNTVGWQVNQVLRHENTAAFCVCSPLAHPKCVVALDACSDYQRNGFVFFRAAELLEGRLPLDWGGYRLSPANEFRYRFVKAAAKDKVADQVIPQLLAMDFDSREGFADWMLTRWNIQLRGWDVIALRGCLTELKRHCGPAMNRLRLAHLRRLSRRCLKPDGLLLVITQGDPEWLREITDCYSRLYFRRCIQVRRATARNRLDLIRSTLVIAESTTPGFMIGLDPDSVLRVPGGLTIQETLEQIARHLHGRCMKRENLA